MSILVLAPHADDEVLGAGGTISKLTSQGLDVFVAILTGIGTPPHPLFEESTIELVRASCVKACDHLGVREVIFKNLPTACLDYTPAWQTNKVIHELIEEVRPVQLFVPFANDLHKDHAAIAYAASVATRPYLELSKHIHRILAYETLSETHLAPAYLEPTFQPNAFVDISDHLTRKLDAMRIYKDQLQPEHMPRSIRALKALATLRGTHIGVNSAEGFVILRELL